MKKYLFIGLLFLLVGCSSPEKEDKISAIESNPSPTPSLSSANVNNASPSLNPEALPDLSNKEKLGEVSADNDLIDSFYFDGNGVKVNLTVAADKACFLYVRRSTPDRVGEVEIESLRREKLGLWRSYNTQRLLTQPAGNKLKVYSSSEELSSTYENPAVSQEMLVAVKELKEREKPFKLLLRQDLRASDSARRIYINQCQKLGNFYYKEELPPLTEKERKDFGKTVEKSTNN
ncbi:hypothetical protein [Nostoc sp. UHCC 0251]|uniref:hypothetical protein n=1 Tax=Nostoc sp. UHCC 0251 TaxID=3110240 RepID=UPI002B1EBCC4|nr:hypothetical protein [Nostoc sp. UHCC 0251]MEA5624503.1 hypothetical protein [Nostoc sp. UHCC 0251]